MKTPPVTNIESFKGWLTQTSLIFKNVIEICNAKYKNVLSNICQNVKLINKWVYNNLDMFLI